MAEDPDSIQVDVDIPDPPASTTSVDVLLAMTEETEDWRAEDELDELKRAAIVERKAVRPKSRRQKLMLPTPYEFAVVAVPEANRPSKPPPLPSKTSRAPSTRPPPLPGSASASGTPPPLPVSALPQGLSSGPPPLPTSAATTNSSGPPPLPTSAQVRKSLPPPLPKVGEPRIEAKPDTRPDALEAEIDEALAPLNQDVSALDALQQLLSARATLLSDADDKVGLARVHVELASLSECILGEDARAISHAEAALKLDPNLGVAHSILRRRKHSKNSLGAILLHLEHELLAVTSESATVYLLAERARVADAAGEIPSAVRELWGRALAHSPEHPAALKGLEGVLVREASAVRRDDVAGHQVAWLRVVEHLGKLAEADGAQPALAAWLHAERAWFLEWRLGDPRAARAALERAIEIEPSVGTIRSLALRHVAAHGDFLALVVLLEEEAGLETDQARAARLEIDAATIVAEKLGDPKRAIAILERTALRAPTQTNLDRRVLDQLVRLFEAQSLWPEAARARRARLRFLNQPQVVAYELRVLSRIAERLDDLDKAIADVRAALELEPDDETLLEMLDRLLKECGRDDERLALWLSEASRRKDDVARAKAFFVAAEVADTSLSDRDGAIRHLRAAWTASPGNAAVFDRLANLLAPPMRDNLPADARALADLYTQAASLENDKDQKRAHLEKLAFIWEEMHGDAEHAAKIYEDILALFPDDRGAILGLIRTAGRSGDARRTAKALLEQARLSTGERALELKVRAASELASIDPARSLALVEGVIASNRIHREARALETRLHEEAGRWERAALSLKSRIDGATTDKERIGLLLDIAQIQDIKLRMPSDALRSLEAAAALDPTHPVPQEEILRMLESKGDFQTLRDSMELLAKDAPTAEDRQRHLIRAAELDEYRLGNDERAALTYSRALTEAPDDDFLCDRLERILARRAVAEIKGKPAGTVPTGFLELDALWSRRLERAKLPSMIRKYALDLSLIGIELAKDSGHLKGLLESALVDDPSSIPALRLLEFVTRQAGDVNHLARTLSRQGAVFEDPRASLGALYELFALEEWRLPAADAAATCERILRVSARDPIALERAVQHALPAARKGSLAALQRAIGHLRSLVAHSYEDGVRHEAQLRLALLLEKAGERGETSLVKEAVDRYAAALHLDPLSVTAASGLARTASITNNNEGMIDAALSLAELSANGPARGRYFFEAAELLIAEPGPTLRERKERAAECLEKSLDADPNLVDAIARLSTLRHEERHPAKLVDPFRRAIERATDRQAILELGQTLARTAKEDLGDLPLAMTAIRRCRDVAPNDVAVLLTLSEIAIAQGLWPEAVEALTHVVDRSGESRQKMTALFALSNIYAHVLKMEAEAEKTLRRALALNPRHPRALRALLRSLEGKGQGRSDEAASLIEELALVETDIALRADYLLRAADIREGLGQRIRAEKALIEVTATVPDRIECFERLLAFYRRPDGAHDEKGLADALALVIARGEALGHREARWHFALGRLDLESLGRYKEAVDNFERTVALSPQTTEAYAQLIIALAKAGRTAEAGRVGLSLFDDDSKKFRSVSDPERILRIIEDSFSAERRGDEAVVMAELRAFSGTLDEGRLRWLHQRHLGPLDSHHSQLDRAALVTHVLPPEGRHVLLEVAAAVAGIESKMFRTDLADLGIGPKDRITSRSGHPTRALMDRLCRSLGLSDLELVISSNVHRARVIAHDTLWIVLPRGVADMPESAQLATLARALTRISLGVPWLEEMPPGQIEAFLVACGRQVVHGYGADDVDILVSKLIPAFETAVLKHLGRKQRKILEELAVYLSAESGRPLPIDFFMHALARAELRASYLLTGNLIATVDELRGFDAELGTRTDTPSRETLFRLLENPLAGDVFRYAITPEAQALRRRIGTNWT